MNKQQCNHKGRQIDGTWCVDHRHRLVDNAGRFVPPQDVVDAARKATTVAEVRKATPGYYTPLELAKTAVYAGLTGALVDWRSYTTT